MAELTDLGAWQARREEAAPEPAGEPDITFGWDEGSPVTFRNQAVLDDYLADARAAAAADALRGAAEAYGSGLAETGYTRSWLLRRAALSGTHDG